MYCKKCGAEIRRNAKFCAKCGTPAPVVDSVRPDPTHSDPVRPAVTPPAGSTPLFCRKCGAEIRHGAKFCAKCGETAPSAKPSVATAPETYKPPVKPPEEVKKAEEAPKLIITLPETKSGGSNGQFDEWFSDAGDL